MEIDSGGLKTYYYPVPSEEQILGDYVSINRPTRYITPTTSKTVEQPSATLTGTSIMDWALVIIIIIIFVIILWYLYKHLAKKKKYKFW